MTDITRRTALAAKASAVVAAGTALPAAAATPRPSWEKGKAKDFASLAGTTFVGLRDNGEGNVVIAAGILCGGVVIGICVSLVNRNR